MEDWDLPYGGSDSNEVEVLDDNIIDQRRWSIIHELVVRIKDKFYRTTYSVGSTEYQDESPWEYVDEIEFVEVQKVPRTIEVWEAV